MRLPEAPRPVDDRNATRYLPSIVDSGETINIATAHEHRFRLARSNELRVVDEFDVATVVAFAYRVVAGDLTSWLAT
jgi:hypothetical protein